MNAKQKFHAARTCAGIASAVLLLGACSSPPKPAVADGSSRVPANDPERIQALQQKVASDRALLTENNLLRLQVAALQQKLNEMTGIVREALVLPPAASGRPQAAPAPAVPLAGHEALPRRQAPLPAAGIEPALAPATLPANVFSEDASGVVVRVFHAFARTEFEPSPQVAQILRERVRSADTVEVRGHTDSNVINPADKLIAIERAEKARSWLIANGADPLKVRMRYFTAGHFLTENETAEGRAQNRRVEVDIRSATVVGATNPARN